LFHPNTTGDDFAYRIPSTGDVASALTAAGISGATIYADGFEVFGGADDAAKIAEVVRILRVDPSQVVVRAGNLTFVEAS
jgi:hypothetical protein